jgi:glycosyltransferase involved in cell wall biosynthesis
MTCAEPAAVDASAARPGQASPDRPLRVLIVAHSGQQGGAELCLDTALRRLDRTRVDAVVVFANEGPMADSARALGYEVEVMPLSWWLYVDANRWYFKNLLGGCWPRIRRLAALIRERKIDVVYTNTAVIFEGAMAARTAGVPHVWHIHEVLGASQGLRSLAPVPWIQKFIRRYSTTVVFESEAARRVFEALTPLEHASVIPNSLRFDVDDCQQPPAPARAQLNLPPDAWVVGFVGQLIDRKNPLDLVDAFAQVRRRDDVRLLIVGDGPLRPTVEARIKSRGVESACRVAPFQQDVRPVLAAIDVLALPSTHESFGLVLIEAGACGKPAVAYRSQGPEEIIVDSVTGLLLPHNSASGLAAAIQSLHDDRDRCRQLGAAARLHVRERFDAAANARRLEQCLVQAARIRKPGPLPAEAS